MTAFEEALAGPLKPRTEVVTGYADTWPNVVIGGVSQFANWCTDAYTEKGDPVLVARELDPQGIARNTVIQTIGKPQPISGTVVSANGTSVVVDVGGGQTITAVYSSTLGLVGGELVRLLWQGGTATVLVKLTSYVKPPIEPPTTAPPPPKVTTGKLTARATDSATWVPGLGSWNNWAGGMQNVYQGSWAGFTTYGSWFYNGSTKQLAGATINRVQFRVPRRLSAGSYNNSATLHVYVHTSNNRPGGDVARVLGPYNFTIPAGYQGGYVDLPTAAGDQLKGGGGISIAGDPYAGFAGKATDPASGQLVITWTRS